MATFFCDSRNATFSFLIVSVVANMDFNPWNQPFSSTTFRTLNSENRYVTGTSMEYKKTANEINILSVKRLLVPTLVRKNRVSPEDRSTEYDMANNLILRSCVLRR